MKLLLTGITGFLGSHLATTLLTNPQVRIAALVRAEDASRARARVRTALAAAAYDQGLEQAPGLQQVLVIPVPPAALGDGAEPTGHWWQRSDWRAWSAGPEPFEVLHCAANLSFKAEDKAAVFATNVDGTEALLQALRGTPVVCFNYVSTAYVAGREHGHIPAGQALQTPVFNNPYEESKFVTERLVAEHSAREGLPFRSLRPSIIIGHSRTYRSSSTAGFFKVLAQLKALACKAMLVEAQVHLDLPEESTLDLVPIDAVVAETIALLDSGSATHGMTFHLTCERPPRIVDVFKICTPMTGIELRAEARASQQPNTLDRVVERGLRHYLPYLGVQRTFDRSNLHACGAAGKAASPVTSLELLKQISEQYLQPTLPSPA